MPGKSPSILSNHLLTDISQIIEQARTQVKQSVNSAMVLAYWHIGRLIVEEEHQGKSRAAYGAGQLQQLANKLTESYGKGFDERNLRNMRAFFQSFPIWNALRPELSWTHYRILLRVDNHQAREWYMNESATQCWSSRALERQIGTLYYERLLSSKNRALVEAEAKEKTAPLLETSKDYLRDPYILDFLNLEDGFYQESELELGIIDNLQRFLLELGKGFAFVARQQRIRTDDQDFYVDLVFYNFKLKCFLLIDLKLGKLTHQDVGQMDSYIRIYDEQKRGEGDNPSIGLILCSQKSEALAKYSVLENSEQIFASKYLAFLPTEEELKRELERERALVQTRIEEAAAQYTVRDFSTTLWK